MALFQTLSEEELVAFRSRYRNNDLFRHWSPILCQLERKYGGRDAVSLWACSEQCLNQLRQIPHYRDTEIDYILRDLLRETDVLTAVTIMCIVLIRLMNAVEKGHEEEDFDNEPMCLAIMSLLETDSSCKPIYDALTHQFFGRTKGFDGKPVVIQPSDPMLGTLSMDDLAEEDREKIEVVKGKVASITQPLLTFWGEDYFKRWNEMWTDICLDTRLFTLLCRKEPNTSANAWNMNEKMICNIIGMFNSKLDNPADISKLNNSLQPPKNRRSYISNIKPNAGTDSVFAKSADLYAAVEAIVMRHLQQA